MNPIENNAIPNEDAEFVANAAVARWNTIVDALTPVLGQRGVAALYRRTLSVAGRAHPCLLQALDTTDSANLEELHKILTQQTHSTATGAIEASLETFHELLDSLIGPSLTLRLLGSTRSPLFSGSPAQDKST